jgi:multidrug efflux pump subunit AcrB
MSMKSEHQGPIAWMARNHVAANLLMFIFIIGGLLFGSRLKQEFFPEFSLDIVSINVPYPGASPEEVEQGIILSIEDQVRGVDGIKKITSSSSEGIGTITAELLRGANANKTLQDIKNNVDSIQSFPEDAERPIVTLVEARQQAISLIVYGDTDTRSLRSLSERIREDLLQKDTITLVELSGVPDIEIAIEVPEKHLRSYNITLDDIARITREHALELPGGGVKSAGGEILLRTQERRDFAKEYLDIPIIANQSGDIVRLGDIATIRDSFEDSDKEAFFNGKPAIKINVFRVGNQTPMSISDEVYDYIEDSKEWLPQGIEIASWNDSSELYRQRVSLLMRNAAIGLLLVLLLLGLFLDPRLAFWVTIGIPVSILGSFMLIPFFGASINMISLFAFILTLGIVVDDAVVVGEIIYQKREEGMDFLDAAILGCKEIAGPVTFAVLTNIAAFMPLFFVPGTAGKLFLQIPAIVVSVFLVSLVESIFVLPSHLAKKRSTSPFWETLRKPKNFFNKLLKIFIHDLYLPILRVALRFRYATFLSGIGILLITLGCVIGGFIDFSYLPKVDSDIVTAQVALPFGIPMDKTKDIQKNITDAAKASIEQEGSPSISRGIYTQIGSALPKGGPPSPKLSGQGSHILGVQVLLVPTDEREISGVAFANRWREDFTEEVGIESITFNATISAGSGSPIEIEISHPDTNTLNSIAKDIASELSSYSGVFDIDNGLTSGKPQLSFTLKPEAHSLGITSRDLARQVRSRFYGAEALRQQRQRNEVKVLVRLAERERQTLQSVEEMILRTPAGGEIPLVEAADIKMGFSYTSIQRRDGRRVLNITADVDESISNANTVIADLKKTLLDSFQEQYPSFIYSLEGEQRDQAESLEAIGIGFLFSMVVFFALLAIAFKSYIQPIIVMLSIPFGVVGALIGHVILGYEISIMSMFGIMALSGVVINDSLVLIVTVNSYRKLESCSALEAITQACQNRFRPILLTSLTTFFGLAPMIFETSFQARFLIPMAISLGFGILFATVIVLLIVPAVYLIIEDIHKRPKPLD